MHDMQPVEELEGLEAVRSGHVQELFAKLCRGANYACALNHAKDGTCTVIGLKPTVSQISEYEIKQ